MCAKLKLKSAQQVPGYLGGLRQPSIRLVYQSLGGAESEQATSVFGETLPSLLPANPLPVFDFGFAQIDEYVSVLTRLQLATGDVVGQTPILENRSGPDDADTPGEVAVLVPSFTPRIAVRCVEWLENFRAKSDQDRTQKAGLETLSQDLDSFLNQVKPKGLLGTNTRHLLEAALELGIPVLPLPNKAFQFGYGQGARIFQSSTSDVTSTLGSALSRDKAMTRAMLVLGGFPAPQHIVVRSAQEAAKAADHLGWPVVVKPANLDQGVGVHVRLTNVGQVISAFQDAQKSSKKVLVEEYIAGFDWRVNVVNGRVTGVIARLPAGVTGDGQSTIQQLVDLENENPLRGEGTFSMMTKIQMDQTALETLGQRSMAPNSVPDQGQFVPLRNNSNVSSGGTTRPDLERIHPANVALCARVAAHLGLDICGIDIVCQDIAQPIVETNGGIIEVNAQPQLGLTYPNIFREILMEYLAMEPGQQYVPKNRVIMNLDEEKAQDAPIIPPQFYHRDHVGDLVLAWDDRYLDHGLPVQRINIVQHGFSQPKNDLDLGRGDAKRELCNLYTAN